MPETRLPDGAHIGPVPPEHYPLVLNCLDSAFPDTRRGFFHAISMNDPHYSPENSLAVWLDERVVSYIHIFHRTLIFNNEAVSAAGIGSVGTHASHRRKGYARALLGVAAQRLAATGVQAGMLFTGIHPFYESLGWKRIEQTEWRLPVDTLHRLCPPPHNHRTFREPDLDRLVPMHQQQQQRCCGTVLRSREYWLARPSWMNHPLTIVSTPAGEAVAYAYTTQYRTASDTLHVTEFGISSEEWIPALMGTLAEKARALKCTFVQGFFAQTAEVAGWITSRVGIPETAPNRYLMWLDLDPACTASRVQAKVNRNEFLFWQTDAF